MTDFCGSQTGFVSVSTTNNRGFTPEEVAERCLDKIIGTTTGTDSVSFAGIITDMEITSTVGELVIVSCNFVTSGTITSNLE